MIYSAADCSSIESKYNFGVQFGTPFSASETPLELALTVKTGDRELTPELATANYMHESNGFKIKLQVEMYIFSCKQNGMYYLVGKRSEQAMNCCHGDQ